jgi:hypothetical protein
MDKDAKRVAEFMYGGEGHLPKDTRGKRTPKISEIKDKHDDVREFDHPGMGQPWVDHQDLRWESNWNGEEVGFPDVPVVALCKWRDTDVHFYLDSETQEILDIWMLEDGE